MNVSSSTSISAILAFGIIMLYQAAEKLKFSFYLSEDRTMKQQCSYFFSQPSIIFYGSSLPLLPLLAKSLRDSLTNYQMKKYNQQQPNDIHQQESVKREQTNHNLKEQLDDSAEYRYFGSKEKQHFVGDKMSQFIKFEEKESIYRTNGSQTFKGRKSSVVIGQEHIFSRKNGRKNKKHKVHKKKASSQSPSGNNSEEVLPSRKKHLSSTKISFLPYAKIRCGINESQLSNIQESLLLRKVQKWSNTRVSAIRSRELAYLFSGQ